MDLADRNGRPASRTHCIGLIIIIISQICMVNTWTWCLECCTPESNRHPGPRHQESAPPRDSQDRHCSCQPQGPSTTWNAGRLLKVATKFRGNFTIFSSHLSWTCILVRVMAMLRTRPTFFHLLISRLGSTRAPSVSALHQSGISIQYWCHVI